MTARPIRYQRQVSDRNGKIFYTSIASLSHISKVAGHETVDGGRRRCPYRPYPCPAALRPVWIMPQTNTTRRALPLHAGGRGKGGISF